MVVFYFNFTEKALMTDDMDMVPLSPIYVSFNTNPDGEAGGLMPHEGCDMGSFAGTDLSPITSAVHGLYCARGVWLAACRRGRSLLRTRSVTG
jgi:hypothetical protein